MFCSFLITRGGEKARPALLVRSGTGTPNWISPLECQKLAVGTSSFECCEGNHTTIKQCRRVVVKSLLEKIAMARAKTLFDVQEFALARFHKTLSMWWLRGLIDDSSDQSRVSNIISFRQYLRWHSTVDGEWFDRCGISIIMYVVAYDNTSVLRELLDKLESSEFSLRALRLKGAIPPRGITSLGLTGKLPTIVMAMGCASSEIVSLLLEHGANPQATDVAGNTALHFASIVGRTDNVKFWLSRFPKWDLEKKNKVVGGVALGNAVYMGPNRFDLVKVLLNHRASMSLTNYSGASILMSLCASEDCDPELVKLVLESKNCPSVNYRRHGQTLKWRNIYRLARALVRTKLSKSGLMVSLARACGSTALHYAVRRGDVDVVNLLLHHGADPSLTDGLGKSPMDYCDAFPELRGALKRVIHMQERSTKHTIATLHRRNSTATNMKFPMYLVPLDQLHRLYGGKDPRHERIEAHQKLKRRGELVRWKDLPFDANIIFLSHEWVGWNHPDPHGIQLKAFLRVMKRLQSGKISQVETNPFHTLVYKTNRVVRAEEWNELLRTAYVWIDWASMPQPSACPPSAGIEEKKKMGTDLGNAVKSIPACVIFSLSSSLHTPLKI